MHLIEKQRRQLLQGGIGSTEIHGSLASKLNIVEVLLAQDGDDKLSDDAMTAVIFVSFFYNSHNFTIQFSLSLNPATPPWMLMQNACNIDLHHEPSSVA